MTKQKGKDQAERGRLSGKEETKQKERGGGEGD